MLPTAYNPEVDFVEKKKRIIFKLVNLFVMPSSQISFYKNTIRVYPYLDRKRGKLIIDFRKLTYFALQNQMTLKRKKIFVHMARVKFSSNHEVN